MGKKGGNKIAYQRAVPKFLQQYQHLLEPEKNKYSADSQPDNADDEDEREETAKAAFGDYSPEEVAAIEAYKQKHPELTKLDKDALQERIKALSASMKGSTANTGPDSGKRKADDDAAAETEPEEPKEYVLDDGTLKFNKPKKPAKASSEKSSKRAKSAGVKNKALLSFGDDDEEE